MIPLAVTVLFPEKFMYYSDRKQFAKTFTGKVSVRKIRLNQGGYTDCGCYFGVGEPLYCFEDEEGVFADHIRASSREDAIEQVREFYPLAKIRK